MDNTERFRKMRRFRQEIPEDECKELLTYLPRGVLSLVGDQGYPYGVPLDHLYCEEDNRIYFHCAKEGHKLDAIKACNKASYCVMDGGFRKEDDWALNIKSVIVFGKISIVEDEALKIKICSDLTHKFTDDEEYLRKELKNALGRVCCLALDIEHMSGKLVNES